MKKIPERLTYEHIYSTRSRNDNSSSGEHLALLSIARVELDQLHGEKTEKKVEQIKVV